MRIAIENLGSPQWTGGSVYLFNLLRALRSLPAVKPLQILLLSDAGLSVPTDVAEMVDDVAITRPDHHDRRATRRILRQALRSLHLPVPNRFGYKRLIAAAKVEAVFGKSNFGPRLGVPWTGWIPDFQHRHLPEMFEDNERALLDRAFASIAANSNAVILSSRSALADFDTFLPEYAGKGNAVPFVADVPDAAFTADIEGVLATYQLPQRFFYLPNQLWKHKNIEIVIDAVDHLARQGIEVMVVRTGNTGEYRRPDYISDVLSHLASQRIRGHFAFFGMLPRLHVFALIRQSVAVLQPSRFEGWSTSVEECKSLGKRMILSDLPVHREQQPPDSIYFPERSVGDLAAAMASMWKDGRFGPDQKSERIAKAELSRRQQAFGLRFLQVVSGDRKMSNA